MFKKCKVCSEVKLVESFTSIKNKTDKYIPYCKPCSSQKSKLRYKARKLNNAYDKVKNKQCAKCNQILDISNFSKDCTTRTGHTKHCRKCDSVDYKIYLNKGTCSNIYSNIKSSAKSRNLEVCTKEEFIQWFESQKDTCHYCDCTFEEFLKNKKEIQFNDNLKRFRTIFNAPSHNKITRLSIDRKDPSLGYIKGNLAKACWICNSLKCGIWTSWDMNMLLVKTRAVIEGRWTEMKEGL